MGRCHISTFYRFSYTCPLVSENSLYSKYLYDTKLAISEKDYYIFYEILKCYTLECFLICKILNFVAAMCVGYIHLEIKTCSKLLST